MICNVCMEYKPSDEFYAKQRACKSCHRLRGSKWAVENVEKHREMNRRWRSLNPEKSTAATLRYVAQNPVVEAARMASRKAKKISATPAWANKRKIDEIYKVAKEMRDRTGINFHVDHIVPLKSNVVCGFHSENNLRIVEASENIKKGNKFWPNCPVEPLPMKGTA